MISALDGITSVSVSATVSVPCVLSLFVLPHAFKVIIMLTHKRRATAFFFINLYLSLSINLDSGPLIYTCITIIYDTIKLPKIKGFN